VSNQPSDIDRGLFGYRRSSVNQAISDRDIMLRQSENRARDAEARAAELEERMAALQRQVTEQQLRMAERERELTEQMSTFTQRMHELGGQVASRDREMAARDQRIVELQAHIDQLVQQQLEAPPRSDSPVPASEAVSEEVARVLRAAEDSAARIVEQARSTAAHNAAESERQWRELQSSLARFAGWRDRVEPELVDLYARMEELRTRITEIPDRVRAAFAPLAEASSATEAGLMALAEDLNPPLVVAPSPSQSDDDAQGHAEPESGFRDDEEPGAHRSAQ
jgi:chromosome segregation ATPase